MTANALMTSISGDTEVAGTLEIVAPAALYAVDFSTPRSQNPEPELLPPAAGDAALRGEAIDEERRPRDDHHQPPRQIHLSGR